MTNAEFYFEGKGYPFQTVRDVGAIPAIGDFISIETITYEVKSLTWAVDTERGKPELRAAMEVRPVR